MIILTIRTDNPEAEIGLFEDQTQLAYEKWHAHRLLAETIHTKIKVMLESKDKSWQDIEGIVAYKGPGSFTGLRIGLSVANALAASYDCTVSAATGEDWAQQGLERLLRGGADGKIILPEYGAPVFTTKPKK